VIGLDSLINAIQWRHHDVSTDHVPLSEDIAVHDLGLEGTLLFLCPLADLALGADGRHDSGMRMHKKTRGENSKDSKEGILWGMEE
jgi:hypothetical protein